MLQFAPGPLYTFVDLSLMVLYQLESLHLVDYNLIYSQNKNMGFDNISFFTNTPPNQYQNPFTTNKKHLYPYLGFSPIQTQEKKG